MFCAFFASADIKVSVGVGSVLVVNDGSFSCCGTSIAFDLSFLDEGNLKISPGYENILNEQNGLEKEDVAPFFFFTYSGPGQAA